MHKTLQLNQNSMQKIYRYFTFIIIAATLFACSKQVESRTDNLPALQPSNANLNAGEWKTIILKRPDTFAVATPNAVTHVNYVAELNEIKGLQKNLTNNQNDNIKYWAAGGVLRWNETMRALVAKYNLPPYENADGTYPIPSAANPFAYPLFPFANPPYAARAYAYISAAQYDALVACWHYKKLYNRPAPSITDAAIVAKAGATPLPSYPSEAAVIAGVTAEMMKLFFPTEIGAIEQKAKLHQDAAIMSGAATRSDIVAGEALGRQIAQVFIARGRTDNAGKAVGTPADWANFETTTIAKGEIPWISQDKPKRPGMLPLFGNVVPFLFDTATSRALIPPPPPSTSSDKMKQELAEVYSYTKNPTLKNQQLVLFWGDGVGTYTPPGHWNAIAAEDFIKLNLSEVKWARNLALLNMSLMDAGIVCWKTKYIYYNPRPSQLDPRIKTLTGLPNFPAYISGHSTFSGAAASILGYLVPNRAAAYTQMANDASKSRLIGGLHFRADCEVGLQVGAQVGQYAINKAKIDGAN
jgi:hypothetical protein